MIKKEELIEFQRKYNLPLSTIEKDYVLGLLLWGISKHPVLGQEWIFKGGTCLKKCYFEDYRFSEDLDFTLSPTASIDIEIIKQNLEEVFAATENNFGLRVKPSGIDLKPFPDKQGLFIQGKIEYRGSILSSGSLPKIKLDLSKEEILEDIPSFQSLYHPYSDQLELTTQIKCYSIYEIFSEKMRAWVERTRPRDLYDIIHLYTYFKNHAFDLDYLIKIGKKKFAHKTKLFPEDFFSLKESSINTAKADWTYMLAHQIYPLEDFDVYFTKYKEIREWLKQGPFKK